MTKQTLYVRDGWVTAEVMRSNRPRAARPWQLHRFHYTREGERRTSGIENYPTKSEAINVIRRTWIERFGGEIVTRPIEGESK